MIKTEEKEDLLAGMRRLARILNALGNRPGSPLVFYGPSRHIVLRGEDGTIAKSYKEDGPGKRRDELANIQIFWEIDEMRRRLLEEINSPDPTYMGLPTIDTRLDMSRMGFKPHNGTPISIFTAVPGDLLYDKTFKGTATFEDYLRAAVQIARIQQEGKLFKERLSLEDKVRARGAGERDTSYFVERFAEKFLGQLTEYGEVQIPAAQQQLMKVDWEILVAENLVRAHRKGHTGYYFDGNPKHHIIDTATSAIVSFDFEYRIHVPALLGLASLLSFGLSREGKPYLSSEDQSKILDRFLLEIEFVDALHGRARDKAKRMTEYVKNRGEAYGHDLSGPDSDEFYRFQDTLDDKERGAANRRDFLAAWQYALLDRNAAWIGHKARYRAVAEFLLGENIFREEGIKFDITDPIRQNTIEQKQHLEQILAILDQLQKASIRNGRTAQDATSRLYDSFNQLASHPYFSPK